ncbi:MAG TPA: Flp pilus assembly protein CpaB [Actinomycetota bacterium]|nr:Flp pilus assembly protein CpaB [Actinomycetota bacterium]
MVLRRWSPRSKLLLVLALVAGAGSFSIVRGYAAELEALRPSTGEPTAVVVAAVDLVRGSALVEDDLRVEHVPSAYVPPGAIGSVQDAIGQTLVADLAEGEPLTRTRIGSAGGPVASLVPSGLRAFVVPAGVPAGVVRAGDRVDVLATFGGPHPYTDTVGADLEVLSVIDEPEGTFEASGSGGPSLVLLVSPETAERLAHARAFATLSITIAPIDAAA